MLKDIIFFYREMYEESWKIAFALYVYDSSKTPKENGIPPTAVMRQEDTKEDILFFNFETELVIIIVFIFLRSKKR